LILNIRKLLFLVFACALTVSAGSAALAGRSAADQQLYERAHKACSGPEYPYGSRPFINYAGRWFRCAELEWREGKQRGNQRFTGFTTVIIIIVFNNLETNKRSKILWWSGWWSGLGFLLSKDKRMF